MHGEKTLLFICPSLFALTCCSCICFLKVGLSVVLLLDLFSTPQSKHALSYWKQF